MDYVLFLMEGSVSYLENNTVKYLLSEGNLVASVSSFIFNLPSDISITALENCRCLYLKKDWLIDSYAKMEEKQNVNFINIITQETLLFQKKVADMLYLGGTEKLQYILNNFPGIFQSFSSKLIASFAGVEPETLSRLRNKVLKKS